MNRILTTPEKNMDRRLGALVILLVACAVVLTAAAHFFSVFPFDLKISEEIQEQQNPVFALTMLWVSEPGNIWAEAFLIGAVTVIFLVRCQRVEALFVLATTSAILLTAVLKVLVGRPRPPSFPLNPAAFFWSANQYSFPSGHVLFYVVFFGFIAYLAWSLFTGYRRWFIIATCGILILFIAPSRVYLGAHWASDVIGSYVIGTLWLIMIILGYRMAKTRLLAADS
jgi:membrane-associated phospholipid phosphatase